MSQIQIPKGWKLKKLDEISEVTRGISWSKNQESYIQEKNSMAVLRIGNIRERYLDLSNVLYIKNLKPEIIAKNKISEGDILLVASNGNRDFVGRSCKIDKKIEFIYASFLMSISKIFDEVEPDFLLYYLNSPQGWNHIRNSTSTGVGINNLKISELRKMPVFFPNKKLQQKIIEKLNNIFDELDNKKKEILELQKKKIKFIEYFLKNVNGYYFESLLKKEKIVKIKLNEVILNIKLGSNEKAISNGKGVPVLRMPNIQEGKIDYSNLKYTEFSKKDEERYLLRKNDVLVNRTNSPELVGKSAVFEKNEKFAFASYIIRLRVDEKKINPHFLVNFLNSSIGRSYIESVYVKTAGQANINSEHLKSMPILLPEITKQVSIITELAELQFKSEPLRNKLQHFETLERKMKDYLDGLSYSVLDNAFRGKLVN